MWRISLGWKPSDPKVLWDSRVLGLWKWVVPSNTGLICNAPNAKSMSLRILLTGYAMGMSFRIRETSILLRIWIAFWLFECYVDGSRFRMFWGCMCVTQSVRGWAYRTLDALPQAQKKNRNGKGEGKGKGREGEGEGEYSFPTWGPQRITPIGSQESNYAVGPSGGLVMCPALFKSFTLDKL